MSEDASMLSSSGTSTPAIETPTSETTREKIDAENIKFTVVHNDGVQENMMTLLAIKNVFAKQLPKMPKDYIVRLVFDRRHRTYVMSRNGEIIGGCCFRPFSDRQFAEIVFLAVSSTEQVKGYGSKLMNNLKEHCKEIGITYLLTFADNFATGYFKKQGFTEHISLPRDVWSGYIKEYDGGQLMGCPVWGFVDYRELREAIHSQSSRLLDLFVDADSWEEVVYSPDGQVATQKPPMTLQEQISSILDRSMKTSCSWPFREPVDDKVVRGYSSVIKRPIDLQTMTEKNQRGEYKSKAMFEADFDLMFANCVTFNGPNHEVSKRAEELSEFVKPKLGSIVEYQ